MYKLDTTIVGEIPSGRDAMNAQEKTNVHLITELSETAVILTTPEQIRPLRGCQGFTLLELMIVSCIVAILVAIAIPMWPMYQNLAKSTRAMQEIRMIETSIAAFSVDQGKLPDNLTDIGYDTLRDPWGHRYEYTKTPFRMYGTDLINGNIGEGYDLYSKGADGDSDDSIVSDKSLDDIIRAGDGSFVGLASKYAL
jgi:general secretion pathway protein G